MAKTPEFKKGTGPDQLPQGQAGDLNAAVAATPAPALEAEVPPPEAAAASPEAAGTAAPATEAAPPTEQQAPAPITSSDFRPGNDTESFFTAPPKNTTRTAGYARPVSLTDNMNWLPFLQQAVESPGVSANTLEVYRALIRSGQV